MALTVNTNLSSLVTQRSLVETRDDLDRAMERLASGVRVNRAGDDAAGLSIAGRMEAQISAYSKATQNAYDGISLTQTAEGAMEEISQMLQRMRELAMAASNGTYSQQDRASIDLEVQQLKQEIDRISLGSVFNGRQLLNGSYESKLQIGVNASEMVAVAISDLSTASLGGISGTTVNEAVTNASFKGVESKPTITRLDFQSDDEYSFALTVEVPGIMLPSYMGAASSDTAFVTYNITGVVENGGAGDIVGKINQALRSTPDYVKVVESDGTYVDSYAPNDSDSPVVDPIIGVADTLRVSYLGGAVTLENMSGLGIAAASGSVDPVSVAVEDMPTSGNVSRAGSQIAFTSMAGGSVTAGGVTTLSDSLILGPNNLRKVALENKGVEVIATDAVIDFGTATAALANGDQLTFNFDGVSIGPVTASDLNSDSAVNAVDLAIAINKLNLPSSMSVSGTGTQLKVSKENGEDFTLALTAYKDSSDADATITDGDLKLTIQGGSPANFSVSNSVTEISGGTTTDSPVLQSVMYLDLVGTDTYSFEFNTLGGSDVPVTIEFPFNGTTGALEEAAVRLETYLNSGLKNNDSTIDFEVEAKDGRLKVIEKNGTGFKISDFSSNAGGKVMASNEVGQSGTDPAAALLDDTVYASSAQTFSRQPAVPTDVMISFSKDDTYSFTLTDGTATAVINPTKIPTEEIDSSSPEYGFSGAKSPSAIVSAINVALKRAGMDGVISAEMYAPSDINPLDGEMSIRLRHHLGREISIRDFSSENSGEMYVEATPLNSDQISTGVTKILNDDTGTSGRRVKDITVTSESMASDALEVLDRAIEDVNLERAFLGAIQNRLNHTIDNLGKMETNLKASRSRIMDADYAEESANLAKAQVLQQAGTAMLAQANASTQTVLSLLQG